MSDLLRDARGLREKLHRLEVLLEIERGEHGLQDAARATAIERLSASRLIEAEADHLRLTPEGRDFLKDVRSKVGAHGALDWTHADEIDFSKL